MAYVGWPTNVNKIILDNSTIEVGNNATKDDSLETGKPKSRLSCTHPSKVYKVSMDFDWLTKGSDGYTELQRFYRWYEYTLKFKTNYFEFPSIILGPDATTTEWYRITSVIEGQKSGYCERVNMTFESSYEGLITIASETASIDHVDATNGYVDVILSAVPSTAPTSNTWTLYINSTATTITGFAYYDGSNTARIYFTAETSAGSYKVTVGGYSDYFVVS